jgi:hypothetical protein
MGRQSYQRFESLLGRALLEVNCGSTVEARQLPAIAQHLTLDFPDAKILFDPLPNEQYRVPDNRGDVANPAVYMRTLAIPRMVSTDKKWRCLNRISRSHAGPHGHY